MQEVCYNGCNQEPLANELVNELLSKAPQEEVVEGFFAIGRLK